MIGKIFFSPDFFSSLLERAYRELFDHVRKGEEIEAYSLNATSFLKDTSSTARLAISWSVCWFYVAILLALGAVAIIILLDASPDNSCP